MKYDVSLANDHCIFDSNSGFASAAEAVEWAMGRGGEYMAHFCAEGKWVTAHISGDCAKINHGDGWEDRWYTYSAEKLAEYIGKNL